MPSVRQPSQCLNIFFSETALPIKAKLYVESPWVGGTKDCLQHPGHMIKMAAPNAPSYMVKPFKNLFLRNLWTDFHKTLYVALGTSAHHSLFK